MFKKLIGFIARFLIYNGSRLEKFTVEKKERKKDSFQMCLKVAGVTYENRQFSIRYLKDGLSVSFVPDSASKYPGRICIRIGDVEIGYVANKINSDLDKIHGAMNRGYKLSTLSYHKVTGSLGIFGLRVYIKLEL